MVKRIDPRKKDKTPAKVPGVSLYPRTLKEYKKDSHVNIKLCMFKFLDHVKHFLLHSSSAVGDRKGSSDFVADSGHWGICEFIEC